tara:strand:- start:325 stop:1581 length:1257 start_codon:yes stop_codon:yes gene_type:complete
MPNRPTVELESKSYSFSLGLVHRVFLNNTDEVKQTTEDNSYQMIELKALDSTMQTVQRKLPARPLLRGINDSITRGDLVLYTIIKDKVYYIGPLNTKNNPNNSSANFYGKKLEGRDTSDLSLINSDGYGSDYPYAKNTKVQKFKNDILDFFGEDEYDLSKLTDLTLEGRHGNSIRIGSRGIFPNLTIDNNSSGTSENINFGSTISMMSNGSISQNFGLNENTFRLSVDPIPQDGDTVNPFSLNAGNDEGENSFNYRFGFEDDDVTTKNDKDQMIIFSDRITFDARNPLGGDFTVSARNNINFGAGKNFTLNNSGYSVINSNNIYLGVQSKEKTEPMVLGNELRLILIRIMEVLNKSRANVQGVALPLVDSTLATLNLAPTDEIGTILQDLKDLDPQNGSLFLSKHHYIEQNDRSQNEG